ncbi:hypothetical protein GCM10011512_15870 [Tersicoccus solisilvae]|uniref:DUF3349 domain-containing protein n=1 Tax=Tersicoccus solisilvae TaxID=1882339 RepID=A0ABQ1P2W4_9MICC|nr:DUF3349 domain-containing protein [Tersicoccus solisilvae]GGC89730.1 hypothetical protein GCM10011512_15870 [Tersicoccus solisilvae]
MSARIPLVTRVVGWLRAGYPQGIPETDYVTLLGVLGRRLTTEEVLLVAQHLADAGHQAETVTTAQVEEAIRAQLLGRPDPADIARVSSRLAAGGWPLADPGPFDPAADDCDAGEPGVRGDGAGAGRGAFIGRLVGWLREGYPTGVPDTDYVPLLALLRRRMTDDEVAQVARELAGAGLVDPSRVQVGDRIVQVTDQLPTEEDIRRVSDHLARRIGQPSSGDGA